MSDVRDDYPTCERPYRGEVCGCPLTTEGRDGPLRKPTLRCVGCGDHPKVDAATWHRAKAADDAYAREREAEESWSGVSWYALPEHLRAVNARLLERQHVEPPKVDQLALFGGAV